MSTLRKLRRKGSTHKSRVEPLVPEELPFVGKMSEVLLDFAEPLLDTVDYDDNFKAAISLAALCWNCSLLPAHEQPAQLHAIIDDLGKSDALLRLEVQRRMHILLERKRTLFAHDRRIILDCKVIEEPARPRLLVMSTFTESPEQPNL